MIRIAKFLGIFLLVAVSIFGGIYLLNKSAIDAVFRNDLSEGTEWVPKTYSLKGLVEYLAEDPRYYSLVSIQPSRPDSSVYFNGEERRSLGNLAHLMLIAHYVDAVGSGEIDSTAVVDLSRLEALHVPGHENNRFRQAMSDNADQMAELGREMRLEDLVRSLARNNVAAYADYLYYALGKERMASTGERFALQGVEAPLVWAGFVTAWDPRVQKRSFGQIANEYTQMSDSAYHAMILDYGYRYESDAAWRDTIAARVTESTEMLFVEEKLRNRYMTRGVVSEYADFINRLFQDDLLFENERDHLKAILSWPMSNEKTTRDFNAYSAIYDSRMGYLAGVDFGASSYENIPTAQVFVMENIPVGLFLHLSSNLMTQDFQQRLIWDPALRTTALTLLNTSRD
jgi:hypothetical protein